MEEKPIRTLVEWFEELSFMDKLFLHNVFKERERKAFEQRMVLQMTYGGLLGGADNVVS